MKDRNNKYKHKKPKCEWWICDWTQTLEASFMKDKEMKK